MKTKVCSKCGTEKEATNEFFAKEKAVKDGLKAYCKTCRALYCQDNKESIAERKKQYRQENKERIAEHMKQYYQENKEYFTECSKQYQQENKERIAERTKHYYQENKEYIAERRKQYRQENKGYIAEQKKQHQQNNKESITEYSKQYRQDNKERLSEYRKQYCQENPEKCAIHKQRRRARKRQLDSTLTPEQWENIKENFNHKCAYCGKEDKLAQEHFLPLSKGGEYTHNNIVPACKSCNSSKGNKLFHEWYPSYEHYNKAREKHLLQYLGYNNNIQQLSIL